jgi:UDP-GlcNAc:undecaprenyl-phosphate GlcNAc-1-phosphate transferase
MLNYVGFVLAGAILVSCALALLIVPIMRKIAWRFKILDIPDGTIKKHKQPTPYFGGLAIYSVCLIPLLYASFYEVKFLYILGSCTVIALVGLIDDIFVLSPLQKFFGQFCAVFVALIGGWCCDTYSFGLVVSVLWILTIINAFNLIDVMDGLASLVGVCSACGCMLIELNFLVNCTHINIFLLALSAFLAGSLLGFFAYNKPPATIYLGDTGSLLIGGMLGLISLQIGLHIQGFARYGIPIIVLAVPLLELTTLIIIRTFKGIPFYKASPHHFSILLRNNGWSKVGILTYVAIMSFLANLSAYFYVRGYLSHMHIVFLSCTFLVVWFCILLKPNLHT